MCNSEMWGCFTLKNLKLVGISNYQPTIKFRISHGRSFRIRHENSLKAPPSAEITMTSYMACNKPSLSWMLCIPYIKSGYGTQSGSHIRSFRIRHEKSLEVPPSGELAMTSYPACNKPSLSRKPCILHTHIGMERYQKVMVALSEPVMENRLKRL